MKPTPKTLFLAGVAAFFLGLNLLDQGSGQRISDLLPQLPALSRDEISRIELSSATAKVVLTRAEPAAEDAPSEGGEIYLGRELGRWKIIAPFEADADQAAVRALISNFRKEIPIDVRVDQGNLEEYGLDPGNSLVVELWTNAELPEVSFTLGLDGPSGTSFIRLSGEEAVYRARLGGRHRYDRAPGDWRNRVLLDFDRAEASGLTVLRDNTVQLALHRSPTGALDENNEPVLGPWALDPAPPWPVDQLAVDSLVQGLGRLRAGAILGPDFDGGFSPPLATLEVGLIDGTRKQLHLGTRTFEDAAFARVDEDTTVYRIAQSGVAGALRPVIELRDKTMFSFSRGEVDTFSYQEGSLSILLQQDLSTSLWQVVQPANIDVDMKLIFYAINTLATLRAHEVLDTSAAEAQLDEPSARFVVHFLDGHDESLEIGAPTKDSRGRPCWTARVGGQNQIYLLREATVQKLKQGFGRM